MLSWLKLHQGKDASGPGPRGNFSAQGPKLLDVLVFERAVPDRRALIEQAFRDRGVNLFHG